MRIGEFAAICGTKISVLRHYDKQGLLIPSYIDRFTGYRYYSKEQIAAFMQIAALKKAGFSLAEIRGITTGAENADGILRRIERKKAELTAALLRLEEAKKMVLGEMKMSPVSPAIITETENRVKIKSAQIDGNDFNQTCGELERFLISQDYQRISGYMSYGGPESNRQEAVCEAIKLRDTLTPLTEDINLPFVDDQTVIGRWEAIGEFAVKQDFFAEKFVDRRWFGDSVREIYFLPDGERYWCYGWTKGYLLIETGDSSSVNPYEVEEYEGSRYMFVQHKSYAYRRGGRPTVLVLRQLDHTPYSAAQIARKDNIDRPFIDDQRVLGGWTAHSCCRTKESFSPDSPHSEPLYFRHISFMENGRCVSQYGDETIGDDDQQVWTRGYVLRKWNQTACAYEIRTVKGREYLLIEWKSGDYRWGGFDTDYYAFTRDAT